VENLQSSITDGKAEGNEMISQDFQKSQTPQARNPVELLATWDNLWGACRHGWIPYNEVRVWCAGLSDAEGDALWGLLQERAAKGDWVAAK
jgi:hypothetical protein